MKPPSISKITRPRFAPFFTAAAPPLGAALVLLCIVPPLFLPSTSTQDHNVLSFLTLSLSHSLPQSLLLAAFSAIGASLIGVPSAWLIASRPLPSRSMLSAFLVMPLAVPVYVNAFALAELLDFAGPVQSALRSIYPDAQLPSVRSLPGAVAVFSLSLYPYVFVPALVAFSSINPHTLDAARSLGLSSFQTLRRIAVPLARPAIVAGASLVALEALNDVGAVQVLGVQTLSRDVLSFWTTQYNLSAALRVAFILALCAVAVLAVERLSRRNRRRHPLNALPYPARPIPSSQPSKILSLSFCFIPPTLGAALPILVLISLLPSFNSLILSFNQNLILAASNSLLFAAAAASLAACLAILIAAEIRSRPSKINHAFSRLASLGYAIPGALLAVALLAPAARFNNFLHSIFPSVPPLLILASPAILIFAYLIRFLAVPLNAAHAAFEHIPPRIDDAAHTLLPSPSLTLRRVHLPILKPALIGGALLVFLDSLKELPATLILRPSHIETLATHTHLHMSLSLPQNAAAPSLLLAALGAPPLLLAHFLLKPKSTRS